MDLGFVIGIWTTTFRFCIPSTGPQNSGHPGLCHSARYYTNSSPQGLSNSEGRNARAGYSWGPPSGRQPEPPGASQTTRESAMYRTRFKRLQCLPHRGTMAGSRPAFVLVSHETPPIYNILRYGPFLRSRAQRSAVKIAFSASARRCQHFRTCGTTPGSPIFRKFKSLYGPCWGTRL